jgi:hypothetical protein
MLENVFKHACAHESATTSDSAPSDEYPPAQVGLLASAASTRSQIASAPAISAIGAIESSGSISAVPIVPNATTMAHG